MSGYGLLYDLVEDAKPIIAPEYGTKEKTERFNIYDKRGIPIPKENGKYKICKKSSGVASVLSNYDQDASSNYDVLAYSNSHGRVVVGSSNVPQNFSQIEKLVSLKRKRK